MRQALRAGPRAARLVVARCSPPRARSPTHDALLAGHFATSQRRCARTGSCISRTCCCCARGAGQFRHAAARSPAIPQCWCTSTMPAAAAGPEREFRASDGLFTLGEGNYSERDIRGGARLHRLEHRPRQRQYLPAVFHDFGEKTVLGKTRRLNGDEVIDILLARPETARFIAAKRGANSSRPRRMRPRWAAGRRSSATALRGEALLRRGVPRMPSGPPTTARASSSRPWTWWSAPCAPSISARSTCAPPSSPAGPWGRIRSPAEREGAGRWRSLDQFRDAARPQAAARSHFRGSDAGGDGPRGARWLRKPGR